MRQLISTYVFLAFVGTFAVFAVDKRAIIEVVWFGLRYKMLLWQFLAVFLASFGAAVVALAAICRLWCQKTGRIFFNTTDATDICQSDVCWEGKESFETFAKNGDWVNALHILENAKKHRAVSDADYALYKSVALYELALREKNEGNMHAYPRHLVLSHELDPSFVPAALALAEFYVNDEQKLKASKILQDIWRKNPTDKAALAYLDLYEKDTPLERAQRMEHFAVFNALRPFLNNYLKAMFDIKAKLYDKAKAELELFLLKNPATKKVAEMMATLEQDGRHNVAAASRWKKRTDLATKECFWQCACGHKASHWQPFCKKCGAFCRMHWTLCERPVKKRRETK